MNEYLDQLKSAKSESEVDAVINEITPILKRQGVSSNEIVMYFEMGDNNFDFLPEILDHRSTHSNAEKAQEILRKLLRKLKE